MNKLCLEKIRSRLYHGWNPHQLFAHWPCVLRRAGVPRYLQRKSCLEGKPQDISLLCYAIDPVQHRCGGVWLSGKQQNWICLGDNTSKASNSKYYPKGSAELNFMDECDAEEHIEWNQCILQRPLWHICRWRITASVYFCVVVCTDKTQSHVTPVTSEPVNIDWSRALYSEMRLVNASFPVVNLRRQLC